MGSAARPAPDLAADRSAVRLSQRAATRAPGATDCNHALVTCCSISYSATECWAIRNVGYCACTFNVGRACVDGPRRLRYFASEQRVVVWSGGTNGNVCLPFPKVEQLVANNELNTKI